ncbi:MAG: chromate efflux transporter [Thalassobaculum sp.]|uniref:chromate efflux transporter n=1 Tax=Thalassobaculum sp. TaxID=2022740 RepID=UPI0032EAC8E8
MSAVLHTAAAPAATIPAVGFGEATRTWLRIGLLSFGGPAGQIALMHKVLVEEKHWVDEARFLHALNYCMLLPGPEAQQLATYVGWLLHGIRGGVVAGLLFILPGALVMLALAGLYAGYADLALVGAAFFGIKAAVLVVVVEAVLRIGRRALKSRAAVAVAVAAFVAIFFLNAPFPLIVLSAAAIGTLLHQLRPGLLAGTAGHGPAGTSAVDRRPPSGARGAFIAATVCLVLWVAPIALLLAFVGPDNVFGQIALFFSKMAVVTFGGAYAVLSYVAQQAVDGFGWLAPGEMLDGLGLAETTPGPLILVTQFVGFLAAWREAEGMSPWVAGTAGAALTLWVTFVPCFLWIFLGAPFIERLRGNRALDAALSAITAAVVGVVLNLGVWFALHVFFATVDEARFGPVRLLVPAWASVDPAALGLSLLAAIALLRLKLPMPAVLAGSAAAGVALALAG